MEKVELKVVNISYSEIIPIYALILEEKNGGRKIPIIIGFSEAKAITIQLEKINLSRPVTHDLIFRLALVLNIKLIEVNIYKLENNIFYSSLTFQQNENENKIIIDCRTSDAVALALRFNCPIYTTKEIIEKTGTFADLKDIDIDIDIEDEENNKNNKNNEKIFYEKYTVDELEKIMQQAIKNEEYEKASIIRDELNKRKK